MRILPLFQRKKFAYARLPRFETRDDAKHLFFADGFLRLGISPRALMRVHGLDTRQLDLLKYSADQPRVPAGNPGGGQWTSGDTAAAPSDQSASRPASDRHPTSSDIQVASNDKKETDLSESERRALGLPPRKEDVEEGQGVPLQAPVVEEGEGRAQEPTDAPQPVTTSSKSLARALEAAGEKRPNRTAAHHIVARQALGADAARKVLSKYGIGIDDAENGVFLSTEQHKKLHTAEYYRAVTRALTNAKSRNDAIRVLRSIGRLLKAKRFP